MFLSKNVIGSFIWEFDVATKKLDVMPEPEVEVKMGDGDASEFTVDVSQIPMVEESTEASTEEVTEFGTEMMETNLESGFAPEDVMVVPTPEVETEEPTEEVTTEIDTEPETEMETEPVTEATTEVVTEPVAETVVEEATDAANEDLFVMTPEEDIFADAKVHEDTIVAVEDETAYDDFTYFPEHSSKDSLVQEVSATINELVKLNKSQRQKIISYEQRIDQMTDANRKMNDRLREQTRDYEKLRTTAENFKTVVGKLEAKCEVLEGKNEALEAKTHDQERTIYRLTAENTSLREQNLNNEALAQVLAEARSALESDDEEMSYYRKVA